MTGVRWCSRCQVPLLTERCELCGTKYPKPFAADLVPVFAEEMAILKERLGFPQINGSSSDFCLWASKRNYYRLGVKVASVGYGAGESPRLVISGTYELDARATNSSGADLLPDRLYHANKSYIDGIEHEALQFIRRTVQEFRSHIPMVAFSGGKDSAAVSALVRKALGRSSILHITADTTIEAQDTYTYLDVFSRTNPQVPLIRVNPSVGFKEMCNLIGPPSRIQRWCCTSHKAVPMAIVVSALRCNSVGVLTFDGIRSSESPRRAHYSRITYKSKIKGEVLASPIHSWTDLDVWTYILSHGIEFNRAYRYGFRRVGCLPCPFNSRWSEYLIGIRYPEESREWRRFLEEHARRVGHPDPKHFSEVGWRTRAGGRGMNHQVASLEKQACLERDYTYTYRMTRTWSDSVLEYLKPFGEFRGTYDDGVMLKGDLIEVRSRRLIAALKVIRSQNTLRITFSHTKGLRLLVQRLEKQLRKYQSCVLCGSCATVCATGAICVNGRFSLDASKCTGCLSCVAAPGGGPHCQDTFSGDSKL